MRRFSEKDLINYYSVRAPHYEDRDVSARDDDVKQLERLCCDLLKDRTVLEVACGTGIWTSVIARIAKSVLATDINMPMLQIAKSKMNGRSNVRFILADAYDLSSIRPGFNAGFAGWWLSHIDKSKIRSFLEGFHEKLSPGATVILMDDTAKAGDIPSSTDDHNNTYTLRSIGDDSTYEIIKNIFDKATLYEVITGIGHNTKVYTLKYHWLLCYNI